jgi:preprotein translocase subunit YajC
LYSIENISEVAMLIEIAHAMGQVSKGGGAPPGSPGALLINFLPFILIFVIFYFLLIRPQTKRAKEHKAMLDNLKKGDKITTQGGIYGVIDALDPTTVTIKVAENVKIKILRSAIASLRTD